MLGLDSARLYLVAGTRVAGHETAALLNDLVSAGVDVFQLREKEMDDLSLLRAADRLRVACGEARVPFIVNDRPDIAVALEADGVHLGHQDLPTEVVRPIVGDRLIGRSTHSQQQIEEFAGPDVDYIAVGPVFATPTKPGRPGVGPSLLEHAAGHVDLPWFAIGGIDQTNLREILDTGARRIVIVRAITAANDPVAAAAALKRILDSVPL